MEFFLNKKEKDQVMKTKEKLCQKRLFRNLEFEAIFLVLGQYQVLYVIVLSVEC